MHLCLSYICCCTNTMTKSYVVEPGFISAHTSTSQPSIQGIQGRTLRQDPGGWELKQRPWRDTSCCRVPHGLLSLTPYTHRVYLASVGSSHIGLGPPTSIVIQESSTELPTCVLNGGSFSSMSRFVTTDKKADNTASQCRVAVPRT